MVRVKRGIAAAKRRRNVIKKAKGYLGSRSKKFRAAKQAVIKAGVYAYRDRKVRKRQFKKNWIVRINAAVRKEGITYGQFLSRLKKAKIELNRKILADLAINNPKTFKKIVENIKK